MGASFIFQISHLLKKFGQRELLKDINLAFYPVPRSACWAATAPARARS